MRLGRTAAICAGAGLAAATAAVAASALRPNRSEIDSRLGLEHWSVVDDDLHNSNTDMILWQDDFLLVHARSPWHLGSTRSRLEVLRSPDARSFRRLASLQIPGRDVRDPSWR